jgi:hypothetical protein
MLSHAIYTMHEWWLQMLWLRGDAMDGGSRPRNEEYIYLVQKLRS